MLRGCWEITFKWWAESMTVVRWDQSSYIRKYNSLPSWEKRSCLSSKSVTKLCRTPKLHTQLTATSFRRVLGLWGLATEITWKKIYEKKITGWKWYMWMDSLRSWYVFPSLCRDQLFLRTFLVSINASFFSLLGSGGSGLNVTVELGSGGSGLNVTVEIRWFSLLQGHMLYQQGRVPAKSRCSLLFCIMVCLTRFTSFYM